MIFRPWHYEMATMVLDGMKVRDAAARFDRSERMCYYALAAIRKAGNIPLPPVSEMENRPPRARPKSTPPPPGFWPRPRRGERSPSAKDVHVARMAAIAARLGGRP